MKAVVRMSANVNYTLAYNSYLQQQQAATSVAATQSTSSGSFEYAPSVHNKRVQWNALIAVHTSLLQACRRLADDQAVPNSRQYDLVYDMYTDHLQSRRVNRTTTLKELLDIAAKRGSGGDDWDREETADKKVELIESNSEKNALV